MIVVTIASAKDLSMNTFGARLKRLRERRGWSQQELAERAEVPYETIYRVERGRHQEPRVSVAVKLARALGVSLDVLADTYGMHEDKDTELLSAVAS